MELEGVSDLLRFPLWLCVLELKSVGVDLSVCSFLEGRFVRFFLMFFFLVSWYLASGCLASGFWILVLASGFWLVGFWLLAFGFWLLDWWFFGFWLVGVVVSG